MLENVLFISPVIKTIIFHFLTQRTLSISNLQGTKELVRDKERKLGWNQWKGTEKIVRDREKFEIEGI